MRERGGGGRGGGGGGQSRRRKREGLVEKEEEKPSGQEAGREKSGRACPMSLIEVPAAELDASEETPRQYMERTLLLPSLEIAVEDMLKVRAPP